MRVGVARMTGRMPGPVPLVDETADAFVARLLSKEFSPDAGIVFVEEVQRETCHCWIDPAIDVAV